MKKFIETNRENMVKNLIDLVNIPSIVSTATAETPFGDAVQKGLEYVIAKGESFGFEIKRYKNYVAEVSVGTGDYNVGILCHVDVVPASRKWDTKPFDAEIIDGNIYGRGTIDDKGPIVSCLYAMKYLKDNNLVPEGKRVTMIVGTDEEENWESIKYYVKEADKFPDVSIVPDGNFPVIFCEKGLMNFELSAKCEKPFAVGERDFGSKIHIEELKGGNKTNIVPAKAECVICILEKRECSHILEIIANYAKSNDVEFTIEKCDKNKYRITVSGKAAHAMSPERGINAISHLVCALYELTDFGISDRDFLREYKDKIGLNYYGELFGCGINDEPSGKLTFNVGTIHKTDKLINIGINLRYPVTYVYRYMYESIKKTADAMGFSIKIGNCMDPVFFEKESELVRKLMAVYKKCTGDEKSTPIALGGATYARAIPNAIAFGPVFPWQEELAHEANEFLSIDNLMKITEIYIEGLVSLIA